MGKKTKNPQKLEKKRQKLEAEKDKELKISEALKKQLESTQQPNQNNEEDEMGEGFYQQIGTALENEPPLLPPETGDLIIYNPQQNNQSAENEEYAIPGQDEISQAIAAVDPSETLNNQARGAFTGFTWFLGLGHGGAGS